MPGTLCSERLSKRVQRTKTRSLDGLILRAVSLALSSSISSPYQFSALSTLWP
jgi:hypothetical protein